MNLRLLFVVLFAAAALAQVAQPTAPAGAPPNGIAAPVADISGTLAAIQNVAQATSVDLARLRIEKWKADGGTKQQTQANADSIARNLQAALPSLVQQVRSTPQSAAASFKLYRNLGALYEVLASVAESAGAFGPKQEYEMLARDLQQFDQARRAFADRLENLTAQQDAEVMRLRQQLASAPAQQQTVVPGRKIIVDNDAPAPKPSKKSSPAKKPTAPKTTPPQK